MTTPSSVPITRRHVLAGVAAIGATSALVACGTDGGSGGTTPAATGPVTVPVVNVPVGGGTILSDHGVVVTQPAAGDFKAFSAVCTHQGCLVNSVANGKIMCPCHGSEFSVKDGSVVGGPAPAPLPAKTVSVSGDTLTVT